MYTGAGVLSVTPYKVGNLVSIRITMAKSTKEKIDELAESLVKDAYLKTLDGLDRSAALLLQAGSILLILFSGFSGLVFASAPAKLPLIVTMICIFTIVTLLAVVFCAIRTLRRRQLKVSPGMAPMEIQNSWFRVKLHKERWNGYAYLFVYLALFLSGTFAISIIYFHYHGLLVASK